MSTAGRWTVAVLAVFVVIGFAFWRQLDDDQSQNAPGASGLVPGQQTAVRAHRDADTADALAGPRAEAALPPCPPPGAGVGPQVPPGAGVGPQVPPGAGVGPQVPPGAGPQALRGITVECAADGSPVDVAAAVAGRPVLLNLWAYWCAPCADELPALAEYQRRMGSKVLVLTVHQDENETAALLRLAQLGVKLPTLQDGRRAIAAALRVPNVMPATVVLRSDGTVAQIMPRPFTSADDIAGAVNAELGVSG